MARTRQDDAIDFFGTSKLREKPITTKSLQRVADTKKTLLENYDIIENQKIKTNANIKLIQRFLNSAPDNMIQAVVDYISKFKIKK